MPVVEMKREITWRNRIEELESKIGFCLQFGDFLIWVCRKISVPNVVKLFGCDSGFGHGILFCLVAHLPVRMRTAQREEGGDEQREQEMIREYARNDPFLTARGIAVLRDDQTASCNFKYRCISSRPPKYIYFILV